MLLTSSPCVLGDLECYRTIYSHGLAITTPWTIYNHPSARQLYMHTTLWDIIYIGHIIIDFLMQ